MDVVPVVSETLNILTLVTDILIVAWLLLFLFQFIKPVQALRAAIIRLIAQQARLLAFIVALVATLGSLFYSEVAHYTPCLLCWYQRIAMYPQVLILGISIAVNDRKGVMYSMALSIIGVILATYHYYIQLGGATILPCTQIGYSVECSERFTTSYGYITIPMMALSAFTAILILSRMYLHHGKK